MFTHLIIIDIQEKGANSTIFINIVWTVINTIRKTFDMRGTENNMIDDHDTHILKHFGIIITISNEPLLIRAANMMHGIKQYHVEGGVHELENIPYEFSGSI